jgi:hypothetical protein
MAGVHGLEQVERFRSAHLADDDAASSTPFEISGDFDDV